MLVWYLNSYPWQKLNNLFKNENVNLNETMMHDNVQTMTSLEIAELTGKQHKNLMQAIRKMEPRMKKVNYNNVSDALSKYVDSKDNGVAKCDTHRRLC